MSYQLNYTGLEMDEVARHTLTPDYFGYSANDDVADVITISTADNYQTVIPDPGHLNSYLTDEFTYDPFTGEITYTGDGELYALTGNVSIDSSVVNTIAHFAIAVNGTIVFEEFS